MLDALDPANKALLVDDELVDVNRRQVVDELHAVPGTAVVLTGFHLVHAVPEGAVHVVVTLRQQGHVVDQLVDDLVVVEVFRQPGDRGGALAHQNRQIPTGAALVTLNGNAVFHFLRVGAAENLVDQADGLAAFGSNALFAGFKLVQFLQYGHRNGNVMLLKIQQRVGVVDQHIGVEGVQGWGGGLGASVVIHTRSPSCSSQATQGRVCAAEGPSTPQCRG